MKTKFILHGGFNSEKTGKDNSDFYKEILKDSPENTKVLLVPFAKDMDRIDRAIEKVTNEFKGNIVINVAKEENFMEQIISADVVYFHGGVSLKLLEALKRYPDLKEFLKGKIVAGESAGANVLGAFFYSPQADAVFEGLGILPIRIIPHYKEEYKNKLDSIFDSGSFYIFS